MSPPPFVSRFDFGGGWSLKVERMRKALFSLTIVFLPLTAGCRTAPSSAPSPSTGMNGIAQSQKTKQDLAIESIKRRSGLVQVDPEDLQKSVVVADLHGFY